MSPSASRPADRVVLRPEERRDAVLGVIRGATQKLALSLFRCNDKLFFEELTAAVRRGVEVEVLLTPRAKGSKAKLQRLWEQVEATGATVAAYNDPVVKYHAKYVVADDGPAVVASLNFTRKCFTRTCDAILITHDPDVMSGLRVLMAADRAGHPLPDALPDRLIVGPERARRQITALIEGARTSVRLIDPKLSDPAILSLLNTRRDQGLRVEIYGERSFAGMKSHGKILLIDGTHAVIGSIALTAMSLDFRREVAVRIDEPSAVATVRAWFETLDSVSVTPALRDAASAVPRPGPA